MSAIHSSRGFTLIEVVVALGLLSLLMLIAMTAFRGLGQTASRLDLAATTHDEQRIVGTFLRHTLGAARAVRSDADEMASFDAATMPFRGDDRSLSWVSVLPARDGIGGLSQLRLALAHADGGTRLILAFAPFAPLDTSRPATDRSQLIERVLLDRVSEFELHYRGLGETEWTRYWHDSTTLPGHVRISLALAHHRWPPLVIAIAEAGPRPSRTLASVLAPSRPGASSEAAS